MKKKTKFQLAIFCLLQVVFAGCGQIDTDQTQSPANNPTTDATPLFPKVTYDTENFSVRRVFYPDSSTTVSKKDSTSSEVESYLWQQAEGPTIVTISNSDKIETVVSNLKPGISVFVLSITDQSTGKITSETVQVTVLEKKTWMVEGALREAYFHPPMNPSISSPIIYAFHGHGGTDQGFAEKGFELYWHEAIVVYPQGLQTKSPSDLDCKSSGWQHSAGEINCISGKTDQDLKFFDAMQISFAEDLRVDPSRVYAHGWSNGGNFVYDVLWATRSSTFAALAPSSAILGTISGKTPIDMMSIAGKSDPNVNFTKQENSNKQVRSLDDCTSSSQAWAKGPANLLGTKYVSPNGKSVVFVQYDGGHAYPYTVPPYIVQFFQEAVPK